MADILYTFEDQIYLNLTNQCPCRCTFCIRQNSDTVGDAETLWHKTQPTIEEILSAIDSFDFGNHNSVVICGYGEPTSELGILTTVCKHIKEKFGFKIRLNTNGLSDLINGRDTAKEICENIDSISISLNAPNAEKYNEIARPKFGLPSFDALIKFAENCKKYLTDMRFSVVDVISKEDIAACQKLADSMGIPLRVREYTAE